MQRRVQIVGFCHISKPVDNRNLIIEVCDSLGELIRTRATRMDGRLHNRAEIRAEQLAVMLDGEFTGEFEDAFTLTASVISVNERLNGTMIPLGSFVRSDDGYRYFKSRAITGCDSRNRLTLDEQSVDVLKTNIDKWTESFSNV